MSTQQYQEVCKGEFNEIKELIKKLDDRMFKDNGTKSVQSKLNTVIDWQDKHDKETSEAIEVVHLETELAVAKVKALTANAVKIADGKSPSISFDFIFGNWKRIGIVIGGIIWVTSITYTSLKSASAEQLNKAIVKLNTIITDVNEINK
jgi:uncharacterized protein YqfB (UPF0267 family)